jgi:tRNA (mo5U34)-methyltransferase
VSAPTIDDVGLWYHTLELPGGAATPGWFDLRRVVGTLPWPDVRGKRCLDVGTYDGFYAFELERRGAAEVVATDIADHEHWDWPAAARARGGEALALLAGEKGRGFEVASAALQSSARKVEVSVYDLNPAEFGTFDVVVCGSLMLHLRDPVRALEAIRSVCRSWLLSIEEVSRRLSVVFPNRPVADMSFDEQLCQWWVVNARGHRRLVEIAGFETVSVKRPFTLPFGAGNPSFRAERHGPLGGRFTSRAARGVTHAALLARPLLDAPPPGG